MAMLHFDRAVNVQAGKRIDPDARYCRETTNEIRSRASGWTVWAEHAYRSHETGRIQYKSFPLCRYDSELEAHASAGRQLVGEAGKSRHRLHECWTTRVWIERETR